MNAESTMYRQIRPASLMKQKVKNTNKVTL